MLLIKIKGYLTWLFANFILCLLPIAIHLLIKNSVPQVFSGFLSFSYTILIVNLYLFLGHFNKNTTGKAVPSFTILLTWTFFFCIWAFFFVYSAPISPSFNNYVNTRIVFFFFLILSVTFASSLFLSRPSIKDSIDEEMAKREAQGVERTAERTRRLKDKLKKEGDRI